MTDRPTAGSVFSGQTSSKLSALFLSFLLVGINIGGFSIMMEGDSVLDFWTELNCTVGLFELRSAAACWKVMIGV